MTNRTLLRRLEGLNDQLAAAHKAGEPMSNASKGAERDAFVDTFLRGVLPSIYRLGSGDIVDSYENHSGQLDVVIEYPFGPSFPSVGLPEPRLYLAETVAAVIEVKSDLAGQWGQVRAKSAKVAGLKRHVDPIMTQAVGDLSRVPFFVVGFTGWSDTETLLRKVQDLPDVDGVLQLDRMFLHGPKMGSSGGPAALGAFAFQLTQHIAALNFAGLAFTSRYFGLAEDVR